MEPGEVFVVGSGTFAAEITDWVLALGYPVPGLIEVLDHRRIGRVINSRPVVSSELPYEGAVAVVGLGGNRRETWGRVAVKGWSSTPIVHPAANLAADVQLGDGATVGPGAVIGAAASVEEHVIVSRGTLVGHHVQIGQFASVNPGVNIGGNARIGSDVFIGMGATVVDRVVVGDRAVIAAGAVVLRDVEPGVRVQGVPARPVELPVRAARRMHP